MSNSNKDNNDFDESDEEFTRGEFGSSKWSSTSSSIASSSAVANEQTSTPLVSPKQDLLDTNLVEYLLEHKDDVTLDSIKAMQELLSELKLSQPGKETVEHISELRTKYFAQGDTDYLRKELDEVKKSKRLIEMKLQIAKKVHADELRSMDKTKFDDMLKINGGKEYVQSMKDRAKLKEDSFMTLKNESDHLRKEVECLRERCTRATKLSNHYFQLYKDSEAAKSKLETVPMSRERNINNDRMLLVTSPANSLDDGHVPPPPPMDMPTIDEIMRQAKSPPLMSMHSLNNHQAQQQHHDSRDHSSANNSQYNSLGLLDNSIPPPPLDDVDLDEILGHISHSEQRQALPSHGSMYNTNR